MSGILPKPKTVEEGKLELSAAGVPGIYFSEKEFLPSIGGFAAYGLNSDIEIKFGASIYTEVVEPLESNEQNNSVNVESGFGYGFGIGPKIQFPDNEFMEVLGFNRELDWAIDLPIAYCSEDSRIGEGIVLHRQLLVPCS